MVLLRVICRGDVFRDISVYFEQIQKRKCWKASLRVMRAHPCPLCRQETWSLVPILPLTPRHLQQCLHVGEKVSLRHTFTLRFKGHSKLNKYNTWYQAPWGMKCPKTIWKMSSLDLKFQVNHSDLQRTILEYMKSEQKHYNHFFKIRILKRKSITSMILEQLSKTCIHVAGSIMVS